MEKDAKSTFFGANPFSKAFEEFDENAFFDNLHNQVRNKPYFEQYRGFKNTLLWLSYLFNLASALTASYAIFWLVQWLTGLAIVGYIVAAVFLFFLEKVKRKSSTEFWQVYFFRQSTAVGWLGLSVFCLLLSLASSGFGVKQGTETLSPTPELLAADSTLQYYYAEIEQLEKKSADLRGNKDRTGTTFYKLSDAISANETAILEYRAEAKRLEKILEGKNGQLTDAYMKEVDLTAWSLVWITLLMEMLFEACIAYIWYYYYRSYVERIGAQKAHNVQTKATTKAHKPHSPTLEELQTTIALLQKENEALRTHEDTPNTDIPLPQGKPLNGSEINNRTPIGFKLKHMRTHEDTAQKDEVGKQSPSDTAVMETLVMGDRYTVPHTYTRSGKTTTVHYNATMVKSRIGEYQRKIAEAIEKEMGEGILKNRRQWLAYWNGKQEELRQKLVNS